MKTFGLIIIICFWLLVINVLLKFKFDKLTKYKNWELHMMPTWLILTYMFFGIFLFPFYKRVKQYRKEFYIKRMITRYEWNNLSSYIGSFKDDKADEEYFNNKRYLKLITISKKAKKNVYLKKFGIRTI